MKQTNIPVMRPHLPPLEEYYREIQSVWDNHWLTNSGPKHTEFETQLKRYLSVDNIALFTNGHLALEAAIQALELTGEVITSPYTFASTTQAILHSGLTPVFCDISPDSYTMDPSKIEALITPRTSAILPIHVYGNVCDYEAIDSIAQKYGLKVIYDAAHAFGIRVNGKSIADLGDASMFSFHATKVFHSIEGGALVYRRPELEDILRSWKNFGIVDVERVERVATNAKMTEFQACMGLCNLRNLSQTMESRKKAVQRYRNHLGQHPGLLLSPEVPGVTYNYAYFAVQVIPEEFGESRDELAQKLESKGIQTRKYFYPLTSQLSIPGLKAQHTPIAEKVSSQILTLPLYTDIALEDVDKVCEAVLEK